MSFHDAKTISRKQKRGSSRSYSTIEVGHGSDANNQGSRKGIMVEIGRGCPGLVDIATFACDLAAARPAVDPCSPGQWAGLICEAAMRTGLSAGIQRVHSPGINHMALVVSRAPMMCNHPSMPVMVARDGSRYDIRSETSISILGASDEDLQALRESLVTDIPLYKLRDLFNNGHIVMLQNPIDGNWKAVAKEIRLEA